jgi:hypothetical protein
VKWKSPLFALKKRVYKKDEQCASHENNRVIGRKNKEAT